VKVVRHQDRDFTRALQSLDRRFAPDPTLTERVIEIIEQVRRCGDRALLELTAHFGGPKLKASQLLVTEREFAAARGQVRRETKRAIAAAIANVRDFARRSLRTDWTASNHQGVLVGERFDPFERVGVYIPAGTAPLVSTAVMTVTLAAVAGVPQIVVTTPPGGDARINPDLLYALEKTGATEVYKVGGAQAIAALAYGTQTIGAVSKVFGPGNAFVVEAKRQVFGHVAVDLLPGPSEILVIADDSANPMWVAADMLAQAEHGVGSWICLVSTSEKIVEAVQRELFNQIAKLRRREHLNHVLEETSLLILVKDLAQAVEIANRFAPEHLSVVTRHNRRVAKQVRTAGAIFLGSFSPVVGGDFVAGPSHELPTGGAGKSFSGLTVNQFQRRTSIVEFNRISLKRSLPLIQAFSKAEGLDAHARSAEVRFSENSRL
jgi:histidinol dehydrogenase